MNPAPPVTRDLPASVRGIGWGRTSLAWHSFPIPVKIAAYGAYGRTVGLSRKSFLQRLRRAALPAPPYRPFLFPADEASLDDAAVARLRARSLAGPWDRA